jgi:hypothetical protein
MRLLILMDNFEQIVEAAPFVSSLLTDTPNAKVLVTSREPLDMGSEQRYAVEPLRERFTQQPHLGVIWRNDHHVAVCEWPLKGTFPKRVADESFDLLRDRLGLLFRVNAVLLVSDGEPADADTVRGSAPHSPIESSRPS